MGAAAPRPGRPNPSKRCSPPRLPRSDDKEDGCEKHFRTFELYVFIIHLDLLLGSTFLRKATSYKIEYKLKEPTQSRGSLCYV
jgi:hypothetical protein